MWPDLIAKAKKGGLDVIQTYVFWDVHEPTRRSVKSSSSSSSSSTTCTDLYIATAFDECLLPV
jgi:hypothetical protein